MSRINRRRFIFHSAHSTIGLSASLAAITQREVLAEFLEVETSPRPPVRPLHVCLLSGSEEYHSDESLTWFGDYLEQSFGVKASKAFAKGLSELPGLEALDACDCLIIFTRRLEISGEPLERIKRYILGGRPVIGIRTASHAFQNWLELDKLVFGGDYQNHYGRDFLPHIEVVETAKDHPLVQGFEPYTSSGSLYRNPHLAPDTTVLLKGTIPGHSEPVAWTRTHKGARVFYTSLGHRDDFRQKSFVRMLSRAVFWVCERDFPDGL